MKFKHLTGGQEGSAPVDFHELTKHPSSNQAARCSFSGDASKILKLGEWKQTLQMSCQGHSWK